MSDTQKSEVGTFCWNELMTSNTNKAQEFYKELFGWTSTTKDVGGKDYTTFMHGDKPIAGMLETPKGHEQMPPHWMSYINIEDIEKTLQKVQKLGGTIIVPKSMAGDMGYFAVIQDPTGAHFSLWQMLSDKAC